MARIEDIARELNVSVSLVSKVLSGRMGSTRVSPRVAEAIRGRADALGYRKNVSAAGLATGRQHTIGVLMHALGVPGSGIAEAMLHGISREAAAHNQRVILQFFHEDNQMRSWIDEVDHTSVDGVMVCGGMHWDLLADYLALQQRRVPIVTLHDRQMHPSIGTVGCLQAGVGRMAAEHLIRGGCRRPAISGANYSQARGSREVLREADLPCDPSRVFVARGYLWTTGEEAVAHFASEGVQYDGLIAHSDQQAAGAINALIRSGRRVPEDVKIIGVDNSAACDFAVVPLSSISQQERTQGLLGVRMLMSLIENPQQRPDPVWVEPVLHARRSSAAPA